MEAPKKLSITLRNRVHGGVFGACIGDALGVPVEFLSREELRRDPVRDYRAYGTHNQPAGTWSDDSSLMLALLEALGEGFTLQKLAGKFLAWWSYGFFTAHGEVFDIGIATSRALDRLATGIDPTLAGGDTAMDNGNGALMRILPLAFFLESRQFPGSRENELQLILKVCSLTHRHNISNTACIVFLDFARSLVRGAVPATALQSVRKRSDEYRSILGTNHAHHFDRILDSAFTDIPESQIHSTGFVIHTLEASLWCLLNEHDYPAATLRAVNLGDDSDTTAAVTGGLAGIYYGIDSIPPKWQAGLAQRDWIAGLSETFLNSL